MGDDNFRNRVLARAVKRANEQREKAKEPPLPANLTPHGLRHTVCSQLYAVGRTPIRSWPNLGIPTRCSRCASTRSLDALRRGEREGLRP